MDLRSRMVEVLSSMFFILLAHVLFSQPSFAQNQLFQGYDNSKVLYGYVENGVSYVPIGQIWRQLELEAAVDSKSKKVQLKTDQHTLIVGYESKEAKFNGKTISLPHSTKIINGSLYIPIKSIADLIGIRIHLKDQRNLEIHFDQKTLLLQLKPMTSAYLYQPQQIKSIMYHHFDEKNNHSSYIAANQFRQQLDALLNDGYETITDHDLLQYKTNKFFRLPKKPLLITIDDGYKSNYKIAYPILKEKGLRATIYVVTSYRGIQPGYLEHFSWEEGKEMYDSGVINIESHTDNLHYYIKKGNKEKPAILVRKENENEQSYKQRIYQDLKSSKDLIEKHIGKEVISLAYPYSAYDDTIANITKEAGFQLQLVIDDQKNVRNTSPFIYRINADGRDSGEKLVKELNEINQ